MSDFRADCGCIVRDDGSFRAQCNHHEQRGACSNCVRLEDANNELEGAGILNRNAIKRLQAEVDRLRAALRSVAIYDQDELPNPNERPNPGGFDWQRRSLKQEKIAREALSVSK